MAALHRRRLLATASALVAVGPLAGCLDQQSTGEEASGPVRGDATVDYPGMVDGEATVSGDEREIRYEDPERTFTFRYAYEGDSDDPSELRISRDLSGETMAAFVAPVYDADADAFAYHVFANEAFLAHGEWYYISGPSTDPIDTGDASFESLGDGVSRFVVGPVEAGTAGIIDAPPETTGENSESLTGVIITDGTSGTETSRTTPSVAWDFDYDRETSRLTITHEGGDSVDAANLYVRIEADESSTHQPFEGEVTAGTATTLEVPAGVTVRIVWRSDGSRSAVLSEWDVPA